MTAKPATVATPLFCLSVLFGSVSSGAEPLVDGDWPQFRGPDGQGHASAKNLPVRWSETENISWKVRIPGSGFSSPIIVGARIWMTTALDGGKSLRAVAVDSVSGEIVHQPELFRVENPGRPHAKNSHATPTPVADAERIYVHFGTHGTAALSKDGEVVWKNSSLAHHQPYAPASSPIVYENTMIVNCDGTDHQFVVALDRRSGKSVWKTRRGHLDDARKSPRARSFPEEGFMLMAYATPAVIDVGGVPELVSPAAEHVAAYDARTGKELWWLGYRGFSVVGVPVHAHGLVFVQGFAGIGKPTLYAIRPGGRGDISRTHLAWKHPTRAPHVPSYLIVGDELYLVGDNGIMTCVDARTGAEHWKERLGGGHSASPIDADGKIYVCGEKGTTTVLAPGREFRKLATNQLDGRLMASPCASGDALYLRTDTHLYRIERRQSTREARLPRVRR